MKETGLGRGVDTGGLGIRHHSPRALKTDPPRLGALHGENKPLHPLASEVGKDNPTPPGLNPLPLAQPPKSPTLASNLTSGPPSGSTPPPGLNPAPTGTESKTAPSNTPLDLHNPTPTLASEPGPRPLALNATSTTERV
nr:classical arabinogalactan protein 9-like [Penaeus vannamei]